MSDVNFYSSTYSENSGSSIHLLNKNKDKEHENDPMETTPQFIWVGRVYSFLFFKVIFSQENISN